MVNRVELFLLLLLLIANGSPVVARALLGKRMMRPLDGGRMLADGRPVLGRSKTFGGLLAAVLTTTSAALLMGLSWQIGMIIGSFSMLGDACSSFIKRRLGMSSGAPAPGLDHIPESLLPLLVCRPLLGLSWSQVLLLSIAFMISDLLLSRVLYRLGIRAHPY